MGTPSFVEILLPEFSFIVELPAKSLKKGMGTPSFIKKNLPQFSFLIELSTKSFE